MAIATQLGRRACVCLLVAGIAALSDAKQHNILFLFADEMDGRILDPASPQTKPPLPNLHRLAASGAVFTRTYSQSPQCVPSRSAMMVGLRTDQIEVYDNFVGIASTNGTASDPDPKCVKAFSHDECVGFAQSQQAPPTFIDRLATAGYNVTLYGKMHAGAGLTRFPGQINEFPFNAGSGNKCLREWSRGLGPETNTKGLAQNAAQAWNMSAKLTNPRPATNNDYAAIEGCLAVLRGGMRAAGGAPRFLYCSILVPHPPYQTNATYLEAVRALKVTVPAQVPKERLHPNDVSTAMLKGTFDADSVSSDEIELFRRVYFSMCFESDSLLGQVLDALESTGERADSYIMMISDHGEDATEHRQTGKNNMYDSASRVAMILSGPGIAPGQTLPALASLNDVFPTVLGFAGLAPPAGLAGSSLLPLADGTGDPARKDFITAQYHSVFSVTGTFMIRQGAHKLIVYGDNQFGANYPKQFFNLDADPWELNDLASLPSSMPMIQQLESLLHTTMNTSAIDARCKQVQRGLFTKYAYEKHGGAKGCDDLMESIYGSSFNVSDAAKVEAWLGQPCPAKAPPAADPSCQHGIKDATGAVCCAKECGVCAHPSAACRKRPGGGQSCCPSLVEKTGQSCETHGAPCVIGERP